MSELVDPYELDERVYTAISILERLNVSSQDEILKALKQCYAYLSWSQVQRAMREAREMQKMTQEMMKEMD